MLLETVVEQHEIADRCREKVQSRAGGYCYCVQAQRLPSPIIFRQPGRVDVRSEQMTVGNVQHEIHFLQLEGTTLRTRRL